MSLLQRLPLNFKKKVTDALTMTRFHNLRRKNTGSKKKGKAEVAIAFTVVRSLETTDNVSFTQKVCIRELSTNVTFATMLLQEVMVLDLTQKRCTTILGHLIVMNVISKPSQKLLYKIM